MFGQKSKDEMDRLDKLGQEIVRASAADPASENPISRPYLFARVMAEIESAERGRRAPLAPSLLDRLVSARLTTGLATLCLLSALCFWLVRMHPQTTGTDLPTEGAGPSFISEKLTACSISSKEKCVISTEDVLQLLASAKLQEQGK